MFLKNWIVIAILTAVGLGLLGYWLSQPSIPPGVTPQSGEEGGFKDVAAIAGAITTLGTAVFGILGKYNEFREKRLSIATAEVDLERKRKELEKQ